MNTLPEGTEVYYNNMFGRVRFSCDRYTTICVRQFPHDPVRDVCIVVYPEQYSNIELAHGNHSHDL